MNKKPAIDNQTPEQTTPEAHERSHIAPSRHEYMHERYNEKEAHTSAEKARNEAIQQRLHDQEQGKERRAHQVHKHDTSQLRKMDTDRDVSFDQTMEHVRKRLPRPTRGFSRFIHIPAVEQLSDILEKTIARPNAILTGGIFAFVLVLATYGYAKYAGFSLQGSETIIAFGIGWTIGMLYDLAKSAFSGKRLK